MDLLNILTSTQILKTIILLSYLLVAVVIVFYNWLYLVRMLASFEETDLSPPKNIERLVKSSIFTALFAVFLIGVIFLLHVY